MRSFIFILTLIFTITCIAASSFASTVKTESVSSGVYEDGKFTPTGNSFAAVYVINKEKGTVTLDDVIENSREGRPEKGAVYEITNMVISRGISSLNVSSNKKGQEIITAVRDTGHDASEIITIGDNYYQFCCASNGRFYLEYGKAQKSRDINEKGF